MLRLAGDEPLLRQTIDRLSGVVSMEHVLVVTSQDLAGKITTLVPRLPRENVLAEPRPAATGPALTWATMWASARDRQATLLSVHADWYVRDDDGFRQTVIGAMDVAERHDCLVTVGIVPTRPETGYGYIELGEALESGAWRVRRFVEKPSANAAVKLVTDGALWNSGVFAWTAERFLAETNRHAPEIAAHLSHLSAGNVETFYEEVTPIVIDMSHYERSDRVACLKGEFGWDDVGSWAALARIRKTDAAGNVLVGDVFQRDSTGCIVWTDEGAIVVDGARDLVVVQANGVTFVTTTERAVHLKELLATLPPELRDLT